MLKIIKRILIIAASLFFAYCLLFTAYFIYATEYAVHTVDGKLSPDGRYELKLEQIGDPDWPFGPVKARLTLRSGRRRIARHNTQLWDDGANIHEGHWSVKWLDGSVEITLDASEQEPETVILSLD